MLIEFSDGGDGLLTELASERVQALGSIELWQNESDSFLSLGRGSDLVL